MSKRQRLPVTSGLVRLPSQLLGHTGGFCDSNSLVSLVGCNKHLLQLRHADARVCAQMDMAIKKNLCKHLRLWLDEDNWDSASWLAKTRRVDMWPASAYGANKSAYDYLWGNTEDEIVANLVRFDGPRVRLNLAGVTAKMRELRRRGLHRFKVVSPRLLEMLLWSLIDPFQPITDDIWTHPVLAIDGQGGRVAADILKQAQEAIRRMSIDDVGRKWCGAKETRYAQVAKLHRAAGAQPAAAQECIVM